VALLREAGAGSEDDQDECAQGWRARSGDAHRIPPSE
jgi:hypothetical protein